MRTGLGLGLGITFLTRAGSPLAPGEPWIILDSDGNDFTVSNPVKSSSGGNYNASDTVLDSDGNPFTPI